MGQHIFNPADYCFEWTDPKPSETFGWYKWDYEQAHKQAKAARDTLAKELRKTCKHVKCSSNSHSLITRGGIGTGKPQIEILQTSYYVDWTD